MSVGDDFQKTFPEGGDCTKMIEDHWCKQRGVLCHIELVRNHGGHLVNQPCFAVVEKCCKTTFEWNKHN